MVNGHDITHGGFVFALADTAFAIACNDDVTVTVAAGADITFLKSTTAGQTLRATAIERVKRGRTGLYDVTVVDETGDVVAEFRGRSITTDQRLAPMSSACVAEPRRGRPGYDRARRARGRGARVQRVRLRRHLDGDARRPSRPVEVGDLPPLPVEGAAARRRARRGARRARGRARRAGRDRRLAVGAAARTCFDRAVRRARRAAALRDAAAAPARQHRGRARGAATPARVRPCRHGARRRGARCRRAARRHRPADRRAPALRHDQLDRRVVPPRGPGGRVAARGRRARGRGGRVARCRAIRAGRRDCARPARCRTPTPRRAPSRPASARRRTRPARRSGCAARRPSAPRRSRRSRAG